jgi:radical SAM superfamily enzyme YgiQ (UPF0313 family)
MHKIIHRRPGVLLVSFGDEIGVGYIAAYVRHYGFDAPIINFGQESVSPSMIQNIYSQHKPILIGISAYQETMNQVVNVAEIFKRAYNAKVILGGPQAICMPDEGLSELRDVDFLCRGEGEIVCLSLLEALSSNEKLDRVPGISYKLPNGTVKTNQNPEGFLDLDQHPSPYLENIIKAFPRPRVILLSSRGCFGACKFCVTPSFGLRKIRFHSINRVMQELTYLHKRGINSFSFADPAFTVNKERCIKLFSLIIKKRIKINIDCETRPDIVDDELLYLMKKAGVSRILYGLESASQKTQKIIGKNMDIDKITSVVKKTRAHGIVVTLMHIIGLPGDTFDSIIGTLDYVRKWGTEIVAGNYLELYFGSEFQINPKKYGIIVSPEILRKKYPSYLSIGRYFRTREISLMELKKVSVRRQGELFLEALHNNYKRYKKAWGISVQEASEMPWKTIYLLDAVALPKYSPRPIIGTAPVEKVVVASNSVGKINAPGWIVAVNRVLNNLSYNFSMMFLGSSNESFIFSDKRLLGNLFQMLSSSILYNATLSFNFSPLLWLKNKSEIINALFPFARFHLKKPCYALDPVRPKPIRERPLCQLVGLFDITQSVNVTLADYDDIQQTFYKKMGTISLLPFYWFRDDASISAFIEKIDHFQNKIDSRKYIVVGLADFRKSEMLGRIYRDKKSPVSLPPLYLINKGALYFGHRHNLRKRVYSKNAKKLKEYTSLYIDDNGICHHNLDELF